MDRLIAVIATVIAKAEVEDILLISGIALVNTIAIACWLSKHDHVNILSWAGDVNKENEGTYHVYTLRKEQLIKLMGALQ